MSMEHKAYVFDTNRFNEELKEIIITCYDTQNLQLLKKFINDNIGIVCSVYSEELLDDSWETEMEKGDIQELSDFAMTYCYCISQEIGLSYGWDALLSSLNKLNTNFEVEYYILGRAFKSDKFILDPGGMGFGFVYTEDIEDMYNELVNLRQTFVNNENLKLDDVIYDINFEDIVELYDELISIYKQAKDKKCGLLMTF